jgi:AraC-like DNA-binding protein
VRDLAKLRRVRDRIDREYAQPLDVEALARGVNMSAGHLSRQFRIAYGESPYSYLMTRRRRRKGCRHAWRNKSRDRSGIEKREAGSRT